ncbi:hypothetical protein GNF76_27395 [Pseudomonas sp. CCM 7893]|uniref:Uncharacterized protein n=1 Tax=Pseudomonas spelaei TaxID=1055469 RepID=A0A6I3WIQ5_9PSED|nr:PA3371 family protein [Pseudomonas spelaei]MUF08071.1 hypothetical protein [Pseudomonas spelaei]QLG94518.1 hypothetical protein HZF02_22345 [Pseudomonas yamanorum]
MTKSAWLFLTLTLFTGVVGLNITSQDTQTTAFIASGVFGSLWLLAIIVGRRFKFDPVLR